MIFIGMEMLRESFNGTKKVRMKEGPRTNEGTWKVLCQLDRLRRRSSSVWETHLVITEPSAMVDNIQVRRLDTASLIGWLNHSRVMVDQAEVQRYPKKTRLQLRRLIVLWSMVLGENL